MCRWLAYSGPPIYLEDLVFRPEHSLIDQSLASQASETTTNGDGFGIGWYGEREVPGLYRDIQPAWNDSNLRNLAAQIRSPLFFAHVRSATEGSSVQQSNCHPFRHGRWLFMHNGSIREFARIRRPLVLAVAPELFGGIEGTTDSELMFHLALTFGLEDDPAGGIERMAGLVEEVGRQHEVERPLRMTVCVSDGERAFAVRYSSDGQPPSLYHSRTAKRLREPAARGEGAVGDARRHAVVSEPLTDLSERWAEIPASTAVVISGGEIESGPFRPQPPS